MTCDYCGRSFVQPADAKTPEWPWFCDDCGGELRARHVRLHALHPLEVLRPKRLDSRRKAGQ